MALMRCSDSGDEMDDYIERQLDGKKGTKEEHIPEEAPRDGAQPSLAMKKIDFSLRLAWIWCVL